MSVSSLCGLKPRLVSPVTWAWREDLGVKAAYNCYSPFIMKCLLLLLSFIMKCLLLLLSFIMKCLLLLLSFIMKSPGRGSRA